MRDPIAPQPSPAQLAEWSGLFRAGQYLDIHHATRSIAPLHEWHSTDALVFAGRLSSQLGDSPLSNRLHLRAYRQDPNLALATYYMGLTTWGKHGPFEALLFIKDKVAKLPIAPETSAQAYCWLLYARLLGVFKDSSAAEPIFERISRTHSNDPWVWVDKADYLEGQDSYEDALAATDEALRVQPWYRPAVQTRAHLLQLLDRDDDAIALLRAAKERLQSGSVVQNLVNILEEHRQFDELPQLLDDVSRLLPMADVADKRWLSARRCLAAYHRGDIAKALDWARQNGSPYYKTIAERLAASPASVKRVQLEVGFIRQHYQTCAPATLTAISRYWGVAADHQKIAAAICYDGSPDHVERDWAESEGWHVREFRPTWEVAEQLLDRGCPFAVITTEPDSSHMQAAIGYDARLGTLIIRDPYYRQSREWLAENFLSSYAAHGPRAMLLLPANEIGRLDGLSLPDAGLYDHYHQIRRSLHRHDRSLAESALAQLRQEKPDHLLTHWGGFELAIYDGRFSDALDSVRRIRVLFPDDGNWRQTELRLLEKTGDQVGYRRQLHEMGSSLGALPSIRRDYAEELARDARRVSRARAILRALLRRQPLEPRNLRAYANLLWSLREHKESTSFYRLAACRGDKIEYHWDSYFVACRHLGLVDEALSMLRGRFDRLGGQSAQPARTLFESLIAVDHTEEAFEALAEARRRRPDDGSLLLFCAQATCRFGRHEEAAHLLEQAKAREARAQWLRSAAQIADSRCDHLAALAHWRELTQLNAADTVAQSAVARLLAVTQGERAAVEYLREATSIQPYFLPLQQLLVERLRTASAEEALAAVDQMLKLDPADAWALRERALILVRLRRLEEALASAETAVLVAPNTSSSHGVRADVLRALGRMADAHAGYRTGICLSIDADWLYSPLVDTCPTFEAKKSAVEFLHAQLMQQASLDNACLQFRDCARTITPPAELTVMLRQYHAARPEIWSAWSSLSVHLLETNAVAEALEVGQAATQRFPLVPRVWTDLASVHAKLGDPANEIAAIQKALSINPSWSQASRQLSAVYERQHRLDLAEQVLRKAVASDPTNAANRSWLADVSWRRRQPVDALAEMEVALSLNPGLPWAWERLHDWSRAQGDPGRAARLAEKLTETRAGEASNWLQLVRMRFDDPDPSANLKALDRATELDPRETEGWDLRAQLLAKHRRYDEALSSCRPAPFGDSPPWNLQGRAAWIEAQRGHYDQAIESMTMLVRQHPDYRWGWSRLTEWHWEKKQLKEVLPCAEKWAWLEPNNAVPQGYIALVHLDAGRRPEAKAALLRSISIDPLYAYGVNELLKLHLQDSEFESARSVLKHLETHFTPAEALRAEIRLHVAAKDRPAASAALRKIGQLPGDAAEPLRQSVNQLLDAGWFSVVEESMRPLLTEAAAQAEAGEHWVAARRKQLRPWTTLWHLNRKSFAPAQEIQALGAFVSWLGEDKLVLRLWLAKLIWRRKLRAAGQTWGQTGYALITAGRFKAGADWLSDWSSRPTPPEGWMLHNLVLALYSTGRFKESCSVLDAALRLPPDHIYDKLLVWRASEHALDGQPAEAEALLGKVNEANLPKFYQTVVRVTRLLCDAQTGETSQTEQAASDGLARLKEERIGNPSLLSDQALRRLHRRALDKLAKAAHRPWLRLQDRLPRLALSAPASTSSAPEIPRWFFIALVWIGLAAVRSCSGMH